MIWLLTHDNLERERERGSFAIFSCVRKREKKKTIASICVFFFSVIIYIYLLVYVCSCSYTIYLFYFLLRVLCFFSKLFFINNFNFINR